MKRPKQITTLKTLAPFTAEEIDVMAKAINTLATGGGYPMPDKSTIGGFSKSWVGRLLRKSAKMLAKRPELAGDLATVRQLLKRWNK